MADSAPPASRPASSVNEPARRPVAAPPFITPSKSKPPFCARTLIPPACPPPAGAETSTVPPTPSTTEPVADSKVAVPPSVKRDTSRNTFETPARLISEAPFEPRRRSPAVARAISSPLGSTISLSNDTAAPSILKRAPNPPASAADAAAGRTRETAPPALTPCTAACAAVNKGVSSRRPPATSKPPEPTASNRDDALKSTRD